MRRFHRPHSKRKVIWVIEMFRNGYWTACKFEHTRAEARIVLREYKRWYKTTTRIRRYRRIGC